MLGLSGRRFAAWMLILSVLAAPLPIYAQSGPASASASTGGGAGTGGSSGIGGSGSAGTGGSALSASNGPRPSTELYPLWARDLRRGEVVAFGSFPFTVFFTLFAVDAYRYAEKGWDQRYAPWPLKPAGAIEMEENLRIASFAAGVGGAVIVAVVDYFLVKTKRDRNQKELESHGANEPTIIYEPWTKEP
jgi:hypothetical protein